MHVNVNKVSKYIIEISMGLNYTGAFFKKKKKIMKYSTNLVTNSGRLTSTLSLHDRNCAAL
jgi:hypothetical protein